MRAAFGVVFALMLCAAPTHADVALALGPGGELGAWLVAGPLSAAASASPNPASIKPTLSSAPAPGAPRFRLLADGVGGLDLARALGVKRAGSRAIVGGTLRLDRHLDGWLLLSVDGEAAVYVGGRALWRRQIPHARDRSIDAIPLSLPAGTHELVLLLGHAGARWQLDARLVDRERLTSPRGATFVIAGGSESDGARLVRELASVELRPELGENAWLPRLTVAYRRGAPRGVGLAVRARLSGPGVPLGELRLGDVVVGERGTQPLEAVLPAIALSAGTGAARIAADVQVGSARIVQSALVSGRALEAATRARRLLHGIAKAQPPTPSDAEVIAATLEFRIGRLTSLASRSDVVPARLERATRNLANLCDAVENGKSPVHQPGVEHLARRSSIDGRPQRLWVHVPAGYARGTQRRYPLVVLLHGFGGRPRGVLRAFLDRKSDLPHPAVDGFVVAPEAHGNAFYRGAGETEVMNTLDWALATYPIDRARVSVTGVSMGGTGAAHLALRYPDRFAATAPLCGYHSYFVRRDVRNKPLSAWEKQRMHAWSPASWAERGRHVPLYVAHGTKDYPLENSRVLIRRYRELGYDVSEEWPDIGHSVWEKTYAGARLWPWLSSKVRTSAPERVTLIADSLRYGTLHWVRVTGLEAPGERAQADVRRDTPTRVVATTKGVTALELDPPGRAPNAACSLEIDGTRLDFGPGVPIAARRSEGVWQAGALAPMAAGKRRGLEGPIHDVFLGKVAYVWGSLDPRTAAANREVAETLARGRHGIRLAYPVVADRMLSDAIERDHALFLVGNADDHLLLRKIASRLPIAARGGALRVGERSVTGEELGALFVYPDPRRSDRYLVVLTAPTIAGIFRALSLPELLPDFIVYDARVAPAAGEQVLGAARVVSAGFFGWDWALP